MTRLSLSTDVFVAGGGPAGLAVAIAARRRGLRVTVADAAQPPVDKACGEGLMPDGAAALKELGVAIAASESFPFRGIRFLEGAAAAEAAFPSAAGLGVRRIALHRAMTEAADAAGVALMWGRRVTGMGPQGVVLDGDTVRCRWIIGADGARSRIRAWAGLERGSTRVRYGFRRHYGLAPWTEFMEIYWADGFQIYVTPVARGEVCVTSLADDPHHRLDHALARVPDLAARLEGARLLSAERGAVSASRKLSAVCRGNVALVGDASGSVDAITGEGLNLAFRSALALAAALDAGNLERYEAERKRVRKAPAFMASLMLAMADRKSLRRRALGALSSKPNIFSRMLAMHVGALPPAQLAAAAVALGWQMLIA